MKTEQLLPSLPFTSAVFRQEKMHVALTVAFFLLLVMGWSMVILKAIG